MQSQPVTVKDHYDKHLADFYSWMAGDFESRQMEFQKFLEDHSIAPTATGRAIDLGAGHGIQSVSLAKLGFEVLAVDFSAQLLAELQGNARGLSVQPLQEDIRNLKQFADGTYDLIVCCGDTLSHLDSMKQIEELIVDICGLLKSGGAILLSFRDYSLELTGDSRFIPVKSDDARILTCVLEYEDETVRVTDLLYEKGETGWKQRVSSYRKVRLSTNEIIRILESYGMQIRLNQRINGMTTILAGYDT